MNLSSPEADTLIPTLNRELSPTQTSLGPEDYFVLTRVDGKTSVGELCLISGFPREKTVSILDKLHRGGAILFVGTSKGAASPGGDPMAEAVELSVEERRRILDKHASLRTSTLFEVLGVPPDVDRRTLKRAYFKVSKEFHPDRFFGKRLGSFQAKLADLFEYATKAFDILNEPAKCAAYVEYLARKRGLASDAVRARNQKAQAATHFERACTMQVAGEIETALSEFALAVRLDPQPRYFKRSAEAALSAGELSVAEEYARNGVKVAPQDAGIRRTLGRVLRGLGKYDEARRELELALQYDPGNGYIGAELDDLKKFMDSETGRVQGS